MKSKKLTKQQIDSVQPSAKDVYLWDTSPPGFGVRIRSSGAKTFIFSYRPGGGRSASKKRHTIGRYGKITLEQARTLAQQLAGHVAAGGNPAAERAAKRIEDIRDKQTVEAMAEEFVERYAKPRNRSWQEYKRILDRYVKPDLGRRPLHELTRRDISTLLDTVADSNGAVMADHVLAVIRKLCNWHATRDDDFRSPIVAGMARMRPTDIARDRVLDDDEIRAIWNALGNIPGPFSPLVKFLFFTAQRRQEAAEARWVEFDGATWTIPVERYKTKRANVVPLAQSAAALVADLPKLGEFLFTNSGKAAFNGFSKAKAELDKICGVQNWRLHDIRRTSRTLMVRAGVRPDIAERVLGHVIPGVAGIYDRHDYLQEKTAALQALDQQLRLIISGPAVSNVIPLHAAA